MASETGTNNENNGKKFVTLEGLRYFLEKLRYEFAHNGPKSKNQENTSTNEE